MDNAKGTKMMNKYAVYQLPEGHPMIRDMYFLKPAEIEAISDEYEFVARIDARTLDECFRVGNFICEEDESLRRVVPEGMRSISVGDIIHDLDVDASFVVERIGFARIRMKEAV
jgi:hypothetical protein